MTPCNQYPAGSVVPIMFTTYAGSTGASATLTGLAVTDIEIYKGTSMTQRASDAGYALLDTDGIDIDGITGLHGFSIDLGDNTDSGFFAVGSFYTVVVSAVTVDGQTVSFIADRFRITPAESVAGYPKADVSHYGGTAGTFSGGRPEVNTTHIAGTAWASADFSTTMKASINTEADTAASDYGALKPTVAGRTLDVTTTGEAGIDWANIGSPTTSINLSGTTVGTITTYTGNTPQTGDTYALANGASGFVAIYGKVDTEVASIITLLGTPAGASVSADIAAAKVDTAAIKVKTDFLPSATAGAAGGVVIAGSNAATTFATLTSTGAFTINGVSNVSQTGDSYAIVNGASGLVAIYGKVDTEIASIISMLGTPAGASVSADIAAVYDKVDTEVAAIISTLGTPAGASLAADLVTIDDFLDTEIAAIKAKTDSLTFTVANKVDANMLAIDGQTDAADRHQRAAQTMGYGTCVTAGSSTTLVATSALSPAATVADQFKDRAIAFDYNTTTANLRGVVKLITASNTSGVLTVNTLPATPATGDTFTIL